jgi:hypothetical protein
MSLLNEDHNRTDKNDIKEEEEEENTLDSMVMSNLKAACKFLSFDLVGHTQL